MSFVAVIGTPLIGPGSGVVGDPPLVPLPSRPSIGGMPVALVGDQVAFNYSDQRGRQILTITPVLGAVSARAAGLPFALQGTLMSDAGVSVGVPPQILVKAS